MDSKLWIDTFHLNGDQKKFAGLPSFTRVNSHAFTKFAVAEFNTYLRLEPNGPFATETRALIEKNQPQMNADKNAD
ncbi:MAG TPA: hypothetical protein VKB05_15885 [Pyrinomonadaceae bacterium]|nr:hypothetical protein [Pyrinomonadaceae bacterium]